MSRRVDQAIEKEQSAELENLRLSEDGKLIITYLKDKMMAFLIRDGKAECITVMSSSKINPGDIVIALVRDVKRDIDAAFIEVLEGYDGYLPLKNVPSDIRLKQGDLIPVRIISDAQKGKRAKFSAIIDYSKYKNGEELKSKSGHLCKYNFLYKSNEFIFEKLEKVFRKNEYSEIITDIKDIYDLLADRYDFVRLYDDESFSLSKLYSLESALGDALSEKVWLRSGGYLVFNRTEAMTVIDVNSGKYRPAKGTEAEDAFMKVNSEAAEEVCRQMRLRNISGIIIVDFINQKEPANKDKLLEILKISSKSDTEKVSVIDITPLCLAEITRHKNYPSLSEQLQA